MHVAAGLARARARRDFAAASGPAAQLAARADLAATFRPAGQLPSWRARAMSESVLVAYTRYPSQPYCYTDPNIRFAPIGANSIPAAGLYSRAVLYEYTVGYGSTVHVLYTTVLDV